MNIVTLIVYYCAPLTLCLAHLTVRLHRDQHRDGGARLTRIQAIGWGLRSFVPLVNIWIATRFVADVLVGLLTTKPVEQFAEWLAQPAIKPPQDTQDPSE